MVSVHWHDDEHGWCPCDELPGETERLAAWMRAIRHPEKRPQPIAPQEETE